MKTNKEGIKILHEFEDCKLKAYLCPAKVWTIGWGNTFYADGSKVKEGDKMTQIQADRLFEVILAKFESGVRNAIKVTLTDNQFSALVSFAYNVGLANFRGSTLLRKLNINPNDPSIGSEFLRWVNKGSAFEKGLTRRRKAESDLYFKK